MVAGQQTDLIAHQRAAWTSGWEESTRWLAGRDSHIATSHRTSAHWADFFLPAVLLGQRGCCQ